MNVFKGRTGYIVWPQGETGREKTRRNLRLHQP